MTAAVPHDLVKEVLATVIVRTPNRRSRAAGRRIADTTPRALTYVVGVDASQAWAMYWAMRTDAALT